MDIIPVILLVVIVLAGALLYIKMREDHTKDIRKQRENAVNTSRRVLKGQLAEQMFPVIQQHVYGYTLGDMQFIGKLFDYIIVDGYTEAKDEGGEIRKVIFLDIKTGNAKLSAHQEKLKRAIQEGKVEWKTITITDSGKMRES